MRIVDFSVRRPVAVIMAVMMIILLGGVAFKRLSIDLLPQMEIPIGAVVTSYEGAGPQEVEQLVTRPIEEAVATVANVKSLSSVSQPGMSMVIVEYNWGTDMDVAAQEMRAKIDWIKRLLPKDAGSPVVLKFDPSMIPVATIALTGQQDEVELRQLAEKIIKPRLERLEGVALVSIYGGREREIKVLLDPVKMEGYGISISQVVRALQRENLDLSGGKVQEGSKDYLIRIPGGFYDLKDIEGVVVRTAEGRPVRLLDFARVVDGYKDVEMINRMNRRESLAIAVQKQPLANTVKVVRNVRREIAAMEKELPGNLKFETGLDQAKFIEDSIRDLILKIFFGAFLTAAIIYVFLRSFRSTLIICTAIPVALIGACTLIYFSGETLNILTLGGLALGIGMMVDNSIVVLENIYRHRQEGLSLIDAARTGASEVGGAVTGATLTTVAVFIPVVFITGLTAELFAPFSLTVTFALLASLFVSLTLVPMLASRRPAVGSGSDEAERRPRLPDVPGRWMEGLNTLYRYMLGWGLRHRRATVLIAVLVFSASLALMPVVGAEFLPAADQGWIVIKLKMPNGTSLMETDRVVAKIEEEISRLPEVETIFTLVGAGSQRAQGGFGGTEPDRATFDLTLIDRDRRERNAEQVAEVLRQRLGEIPGASIEVEAPRTIVGHGMGGAPVEVILKGDEIDTLASIADKAKAEIAKVPGVRDVESSLAEGRPEVQIIVDRERTAAYGLSVAEVASGVRSAIRGEVATRYRVGGDEIDVRVQLQETARENLADLENLLLAGPGGSVALRDIAGVKIVKGPLAIERRDQARSVAITANLTGRDLASVIGDIKQRLNGFPLPPGYRFEYGGEAKEMTESFGNLSAALVLAILLVYMILAIQFESLGQPVALMLSVPVAVTGMVLGLLLTGRTFNVPAFIGVIVTVGIVVNNAIVLIHYVNQLRARGLERDEAIMRAGPVRLRPVLMTASTTVLAMLPLALGIGKGAELKAPLATVVVGGLLFSTLVSLILVPVVYAIFDDWEKAAVRRLTRPACPSDG